MFERPHSRRMALRFLGGSAAGLALSGCNQSLGGLDSRAGGEPPPADGEAALKRLLEGNARFASGKPVRPNTSTARIAELAKGQKPFAIVFSCVDSRVPPEIVLDWGLGDLLVIRTAGHAIDDAAMGSILFGVSQLNVPLLLVLGHESCGAVSTAIDVLEKNGQAEAELQALVDYFRPAWEMARNRPGDKVDNVVRANIQRTVELLRARKP
jgi:carbonic anhydrase